MNTQITKYSYVNNYDLSCNSLDKNMILFFCDFMILVKFQ